MCKYTGLTVFVQIECTYVCLAVTHTHVCTCAWTCTYRQISSLCPDHKACPEVRLVTCSKSWACLLFLNFCNEESLNPKTLNPISLRITSIFHNFVEQCWWKHLHAMPGLQAGVALWITIRADAMTGPRYGWSPNRGPRTGEGHGSTRAGDAMWLMLLGVNLAHLRGLGRCAPPFFSQGYRIRGLRVSKIV